MMCDVLTVVGSGTGKPTHIAYRANLSWHVVSKLIKDLESKNLITSRAEGKRAFYILTGKGMQIANLYRRIGDGLGFGQPGRPNPLIPSSESEILTVFA